jgi:hypothetical protein
MLCDVFWVPWDRVLYNPARMHRSVLIAVLAFGPQRHWFSSRLPRRRRPRRRTLKSSSPR